MAKNKKRYFKSLEEEVDKIRKKKFLKKNRKEKKYPKWFLDEQDKYDGYELFI